MFLGKYLTRLRDYPREMPSQDPVVHVHDDGGFTALRRLRPRKLLQMGVLPEVITGKLVPNLLPFEGVFQPDQDFGKVYMVSPFLANGTIVEYLKRYPDVERCLLVR